MSDERTPLDLRGARRQLGLSLDGLRILLRLGKNSGATLRRWQAGQLDVPGPVAAFLEVLLKSPEARRVAGVDELAKRHPAFKPGRPAAEDE